MERRIESRFQVSAKIRAIVPGHPARILDCDLSDVSATGIRFVSPEFIQAEEILALEVDLRLILAEVRHCEPRGMRFVVGVRRLHEIEKSAQLTDPVACVREMIADLHSHISAGDEPDSAMVAMRALESILERDGVRDEPLPEAAPAEVEYIEPPRAALQEDVQDDEASEVAPSEAEYLEPVEVETESSSEEESISEVIPADVEYLEPVGQFPPVEESVPEAIPSDEEQVEPVAEVPPVKESVPELIPSDAVEPIAEVPTEPAPAQESDPEPVPFDAEYFEPAAEVPATPHVEPAPVGESLQAAAEVPAMALTEASPLEESIPEVTPSAVPPPADLETTPGPQLVSKTPSQADLLDAIRTAEAEKPGDHPEVSTRKSWRIPLSIAAGLVLAVAVGITIVQRRSEASAPASQIVVGPSRVETPSSAPPATPGPAAASAPVLHPAQIAAQTAHEHHVELKLTDTSWISVATDDHQPFQATLHKGDAHAADFSKQATLWLGNGAGVEITLDGTKLEQLKSGVRVLQLTPDGVKFLKTAPPANP